MPTLQLAIYHKPGQRPQAIGPVSQGFEGLEGLLVLLFRLKTAPVDAHQGWIGVFSFVLILSGRFPHLLARRRHIEQVIDDLKRQAEVLAVSAHGLQHLQARAERLAQGVLHGMRS